jgi:hypothetical protein
VEENEKLKEKYDALFQSKDSGVLQEKVVSLSQENQ